MEQWSTNGQPGPRSTPRDAKWCPELANCGGRGNSQVIKFDFLWCDGDVIKHTPSHRGSHCTFPWCKTRIDWTARRGEVRRVQKTKWTWTWISLKMSGKYQKTLTRKSRAWRQNQSKTGDRKQFVTVFYHSETVEAWRPAWWHPGRISIFAGLFRLQLNQL